MKDKPLALMLVPMLAARAQVPNVAPPGAAPKRKRTARLRRDSRPNAKDGQSCALPEGPVRRWQTDRLWLG
jgi:hypothetical protein